MGLKGWVSNAVQGVIIEAEGSQVNSSNSSWSACHASCRRTHRSRAATRSGSRRSVIQRLPYVTARSEAKDRHRPAGYGDVWTVLGVRFSTRHDRRYRYPFTNCTDCGPRFSIIQALPYDRVHTTMQHFRMCEPCRAEYEHPLDRRFHAQPNACPECGPHLELWDTHGTVLAHARRCLMRHRRGDPPRRGRCCERSRRFSFNRRCTSAGRYHAAAPEQTSAGQAVRPDVSDVGDPCRPACDVSALEVRLLCSAAAPIVLLRRRSGQTADAIAPAVAPHNPYLGIMLPYTPLHHLLMAALGSPVVATSGNIADEPMCIDEAEALTRLHDIAEVFLVHNRPIARSVDDSVVRVIMGREMVVRGGRGYAPCSIHLITPSPSTLALGAHLKTTIAVSIGTDVLIEPACRGPGHAPSIGDVERDDRQL